MIHSGTEQVILRLLTRCSVIYFICPFNLVVSTPSSTTQWGTITLKIISKPLSGHTQHTLINAASAITAVWAGHLRKLSLFCQYSIQGGTWCFSGLQLPSALSDFFTTLILNLHWSRLHRKKKHINDQNQDKAINYWVITQNTIQLRRKTKSRVPFCWFNSNK